MAVVFQPADVLKELLPAKKIKRLVTNRLSLSRAALSTLSKDGGDQIMSKKALEKIAAKTIKGYKARFADKVEAGASKAGALAETLNDRAQLVQRMQNTAVYEINQHLQKQYEGLKAEWLPSSAEEPDPLHQLNYGKIYTVGVGINGEEPGDRYGCKCGVRILTEDEVLYLFADEEDEE